MPTWVRKLVSGAKARFLDEELKVDLDLVYVTDRIIIMGYPAEGVEALYRNNRHDARKFIEHRHGHKYWIFNFCPITENSYPAEFFRGHVSRYPFPDHHAPPLAVMALATREMDVWLRGDPDRVVALHCKAGKGRSGTLACAYLLSLEGPPMAPSLERSMPKKEWSKLRAEEVLEVVTELSDDDFHVITPANSSSAAIDSHSKSGSAGVVPREAINRQTAEQGHSPDDHDQIDTHATLIKASSSASLSKPSAGIYGQKDPSHSSPALIQSASSTSGTGYSMNQPFETSASISPLDSVLAFHSSRRMKQHKSPNRKSRRGVSIPSQRRFLFYWSQMLSNTGPPSFWTKYGSNNIVPSENQTSTRPVTQKIRIESIRVRMADIGETRATAVKVISKVLQKATNGKRGKDKDRGNVWISVARYDDHFVDTLENWEKYTRSDTSIGRRKHGTEFLPEDTKGEQGIGSIFEDGKWDSGKMVQIFGQFGSSSDHDVVEGNEKGPRIITHTLHSIPRSDWIEVTKMLKKDGKGASSAVLEQNANSHDSADGSMSTVSDDGGQNLSQTPMDEGGVIVDANREVRAKLHMGQVPMGWFWFIPAFHMPPLTENEPLPAAEAVHFQLKKSDIDFPWGAGAWIIDIDVSMRWVSGGGE